MSRRSYTGGAVQALLDGAITSTSNTISCDDLDGWPTGAEGPGPFYALIDKDTPGSEEKVLCSSRTGNSLTVITRGADGTTARSHSLGATIEHIHAAVDSDEANDHVNSSQGVHGLDPGDPVVGQTTTATLTNKTIDTANNDVTVAIGDVTGLAAEQAAQDAALAQEVTDRGNADTTLQGNIDTEEAARIAADSAEATTRGDADTTLQGNIDTEEAARIAADAAHVADGDPHPQYLTPAEGDAAYVNVTGDTMTGALTLPGSNPTAANHAARKQYVDNRTPTETRGGTTTVNTNASGAFAIAHGGGAVPIAWQCVQGNTGGFPVMFTGGAVDSTFVNFVAWRLDTNPPTKFDGNVNVSWVCVFAASG